MITDLCSPRVVPIGKPEVCVLKMEFCCRKKSHLFKCDYLLGRLSVKLWGFKNYRMYRCFGESFRIQLLVNYFNQGSSTEK